LLDVIVYKQIDGRLLPSETIKLLGRDVSAGAEADWSRELGHAPPLSGVRIITYVNFRS